MPPAKVPSPESLAKFLDRFERVYLSKRNFQQSLSDRPKSVWEGIHSLQVAFSLPYAFSRVSRDQEPDSEIVSSVMDGHSCLTMFHTEALGLAVRSLLLALYGGYNAGYSLLRGVADLGAQGALVDYLSRNLSAELARVSQWHPRFRSRAESYDLVRKLKALLPRASEFRAEPASFLVEIEDATFGIGFGETTDQLVDWGITRPLRAPYEFVNYRELNYNVHASPSRLDLSRALEYVASRAVVTPEGGDDFGVVLASTFRLAKGEPPAFPVIPNQLDRYVKQLRAVAEFQGILTVNTLADVLHTHPNAKENLGRFQERVRNSGMHSLGQAVELVLRSPSQASPGSNARR